MQPFHVAMVVWAWHIATELWARNPITSKEKAWFFFDACLTATIAAIACQDFESHQVPWGGILYMLGILLLRFFDGVFLDKRKSILAVILNVPAFALVIWFVGQNAKS